jgi:hypothetical protein
VTTLAYTGDLPAQPAKLPILPADSHIRGTFAHFDRFGAFRIVTSSGLQDLPVDTSQKQSKEIWLRLERPGLPDQARAVPGK